MRGLKAALVACARAERVSVSALVRRAVELELERLDASREPAGEPQLTAFAGSTVKLSIRMTRTEAEQLAAAARSAGLSRGAFLSGLVAGIPALAGDGSSSRPDRIAALIASCAELSTLSRNLHRLSQLLRHGDVQAAMEYRRALDTIGDDVRSHLALAAGTLAELRPSHKGSAVDARRRPTAA
ncbi:hypothetical protein V4F39_23705 [Aquincola sp. MAHUQ-54]|uniref:Ribbon-helix-helix CopG family protein n=1 Tax=Aquincola agrisoli TaxID=3119538 RepID=A0AAW9QI45_9BURK